MKWWICLTALVLALTTSAAAADLPAELERAAPEAAEDLTGGDLSGGTGFAQGVGNILDRLADQVGDVVRERTRGAAAVLLVVVLCGVVEGFAQGTGGKGAAFLPMAGALSITLASAGSLDSLMGLGSRTIGELADFSQALLPTLAAATAASGAVTTATVQQVSTVFFVDLLLRLIRQLLLPLVYLYIGLLTAAACLPENRLGAIAEALKKLVTWILTTALLVFTIYLSIVRIISGSADSATVKVAKAAISGVVPVVGGIIADASETVLAGAGMLKNTIGVFGMLAILAEKDLVTKERYGKITLTETGAALAHQLQAGLRDLERRLPALGLDLDREETAAVAGALASALPEHCLRKLCTTESGGTMGCATP